MWSFTLVSLVIVGVILQSVSYGKSAVVSTTIPSGPISITTVKATSATTASSTSASTARSTSGSTARSTSASTARSTSATTARSTSIITSKSLTNSLSSSTSSIPKPSSTTTISFSSTAHITSNSMVVGCYADFYPTSRAMSDASTTSSSNTPATCAAYCTSLGIPYSGTEYGNECYCSTTAPTTVSTACTMACAGSSTKICGGPNALSVMYTTIPTLPATNSTKRGLCWPWNNPASSFAFFSPSAIPWLYNWELWDPRAAGTYSTAEYRDVTIPILSILLCIDDDEIQVLTRIGTGSIGIERIDGNEN